jgi:hypothetical protein
MARGKSSDNAAILEYALTHLERERDEILTKIDHIRRQLFGSRMRLTTAPEHTTETPAAAGTRKKRVLSEAARKRIAAAQKRRWAEHRKAKAKAE